MGAADDGPQKATLPSSRLACWPALGLRSHQGTKGAIRAHLQRLEDHLGAALVSLFGGQLHLFELQELVPQDLRENKAEGWWGGPGWVLGALCSGPKQPATLVGAELATEGDSHACSGSPFTRTPNNHGVPPQPRWEHQACPREKKAASQPERGLTSISS